MMRIRTIKPDFFKHEGLFDAEAESGLHIRLAYIGLWCVADREGRFKWRPRELKSNIMPHDNIDFSKILETLLTKRFIEKYEVDGEFYGAIKSWKSHQRINLREAPSSIPPPCTEMHVHARGEGKGKEGKGKEDIIIAHTKKRNSEFPENFVVSEQHITLAKKNNWPDPNTEVEAFRDYHQARGTVFKDWDKAFYTWLRNAKKFGGNHGNGSANVNKLNNRQASIMRVISACKAGAECN